nr:DUF2207 domain-containing protein [Bacilli bacterium]
MKRIKYFVFSLFVVLFGLAGVKADKTYSIDVTMTLDSNGNAKVVEKWDFKADSGTEIYKPIGELGNSQITNFKASMDGADFTFEPSWDVDASLSEKAYKNGINYTDDGIELCVGKTEYGRHIYTLSYDVSNVIYNVEDAQILYWKFINDNMGNPPEKFSVVVSGPTLYSDELPVWGYGYTSGYAYVYDGQIEMVKESGFRSSEYAVLLAKFPIGTFNIDNTWYRFKTFDDVETLASTGSFKMTFWEKVAAFFMATAWIFIIVIIYIAIYIGSKSNSYAKNKIKESEVNAFRDIPCNKDILNAYFLAKVYNVSKKKEDLFGAALLKWLLDGVVSIREEEKQGVFKAKTITSIDMTKDYTDDTPLGKLYKILKDASKDGILESDELTKWCSSNYNKLYSWFDEVETFVKDRYMEKNQIVKEKNGKLLKYTQFRITAELEEEAIHLVGLKKFLKEFSEMHKKQAIEVNLWEYYLMYAQIFGMAKEVAKQFKNLYPEIVTNMEEAGIDYTNVVLMNNFSTATVNAASAAKVKAESYSSGGGGGSFGGGGGGSFGGGSGGGGR